MRSLTGLLAVLAALAAPVAEADVPLAVSYQGRLLDPNGLARSGPVSVTFRIFDDPNTGTLLYEEIHAAVPLLEGVFDVQIGRGAATVNGTHTVFAADVFAASLRFLEVTVDLETLRPRQAILAVPYALRAGDADTLDGQHAADLDQTAHTIDTLNPHAVTAAQIAAAAEVHGHDGADLAPDSVTAAQIAPAAVGLLELAPDSVRRSSIQGLEVPLYTQNIGCVGGERLFAFEPTCLSDFCVLSGSLGILDCSGTCSLELPDRLTCNNTLRGHLLSPVIP